MKIFYGLLKKEKEPSLDETIFPPDAPLKSHIESELKKLATELEAKLKTHDENAKSEMKAAVSSSNESFIVLQNKLDAAAKAESKIHKQLLQKLYQETNTENPHALNDAIQARLLAVDEKTEGDALTARELNALYDKCWEHSKFAEIYQSYRGYYRYNLRKMIESARPI